MGSVLRVMLRSSDPWRRVETGVNGAAIAASGATVYYRSTFPVDATTNDGSIAAGASATLVGSWWFATAADRADLQVLLLDAVVSTGGGGVSDYALASSYTAGQVVKRNGQTMSALVPITSGWPFHAARWTVLNQRPRGVLNSGWIPISGRYGRWDTTPASGANLSNGTTENEHNSRIAHVAHSDAEGGLVLAFTLPSPAPNDIVFNATVEYPSGTYTAVTFGGARDGKVSVDGWALSDPLHLGVKATEAFWVLTHSRWGAAQTVAISGAPTGGSFTLTNPTNTTTTAAIPWNSTALALKDFIVSAGLYAAEDIAGVSGGPGPATAWVVAFRPGLGTPASMTHVDTFTGGAAPAATVTAGKAKIAYTHRDMETGETAPTGVDTGDLTTKAQAGGANGFSAMAVLHRPATRVPCLSVVGDSVMSPYLSTKSENWARKALGQVISVAQAPKYGETLSAIAGRTRRPWRPFMVAGNWLAVAIGINDIAISVRTAAQMQVDYLALWDRYANDGVRVLTCTVTPKSTSTDAWATVVNQTAFAQNPVRATLNNWMRDGSPIDATTRVAVATGTAVNVYRAGEGTHPLTTTTSFPKGCIDVCAAIENDAVNNDSKWVVGHTTDGLHMVDAGHVAVSGMYAAALQADIV